MWNGEVIRYKHTLAWCVIIGGCKIQFDRIEVRRKVLEERLVMVKFQLKGMFVYPPQKCHVANCERDAFCEFQKTDTSNAKIKTSSVLVCHLHEAEDTLQIGLEL